MGTTLRVARLVRHSLGICPIALGACAADELDGASEFPAELAAHGYAGDVACDQTVTTSAELDAFIADPWTASGAPAGQDTFTACVSGTLELASTPPPAVPGAPCPDDVAGSQFCLVPPAGVAELNIIGLDGADGTKATVEGGFNAFLIPPASTVQRLGIHNLRIVGPTLSAILSFNGGEMSVTHVDVEGVRPFFVPAFNGYLQVGIQVGSANEDIEGPVTLAYNHLDAGDHYAGVNVLIVSAGIALYGRFATPPQNFDWTGTGTVYRNTLDNWGGSGMLVLFADVDITENVVRTGPFANSLPAAQPRGPCSAPNRSATGGGISVGGPLPITIAGNLVSIAPGALTGPGTPPPCQAGILLVDSVGAVVEDNLVLQNGVPPARGIVAVAGSSNVVDGFLVAGGGTGVDLQGSSGNVVDEGLILNAATGVSLTGSSGNSFDDLLIRRATTAWAIDAASTGNTFDDVWPPPP